MIELPIYLTFLWLLIREFGLTGAAVAWTVRLLLDTGALVFVARRYIGLRVTFRALAGWTACGAAIALASYRRALGSRQSS